MSFKSTKVRYFLVIIGVVLSALLVRVLPAQAAGCPAPTTDYGSVTSQISVPSTGNYRVWSRIMTGVAATDNTYSLDVDGTSCYVVGNSSSIPANTWTWVNYQNGDTANLITLNGLTAGTHTLKMVGTADGVKLDRILVIGDLSCVPTGTGDNCASGTDTTNPVVHISAPTGGATVNGTGVPISATATDDSGTVTKTELWIDGTQIGNPDTVAPYHFSWNSTTVNNGSHNITVKAYDPSGNIGSDNVNVNVSNSPPTTAMIAPANNAAISGTYTLSASASDQVAVTKVEFYRDGATLLGTSASTASPYSFSWDTTSVTDGTYALTSKAYNAGSTNNSTVSSPINVLVDNTPPVVNFTAPTNNAFVAGKTVSITANATDTGGSGVKQVDLYIDGSSTAAATDTAAPYAYTWDSTGVNNGVHTLVLKATDNAGNITTSSTDTVTVDNAKPTTSISSPAASAFLAGTQTVHATAADTGGSGLKQVAFFVDGTQVGATLTAAPFNFTWDTTTATPGTHSLTTKATDNAGNVKTSTSVSVTVDNTAPSVNITAPGNGATVSGATTTITATATDTGSGVSKVEFYRNGTTLIGTSTDTTSPYSITWDTTAIADGNYTLTAVAYDKTLVNQTTSSPIPVTVSNNQGPPPDTTKPKISLDAPATGDTVAGTVPINFTASDNVGVTEVDMTIDGATPPTQTSSPPTDFTWDSTSVTDGSHTIKVTAYDAAGNFKSASATVTVNNAPPPLPGDVNNSGAVDGTDLGILLFNWTPPNPQDRVRTQGDLTGEGDVNGTDLGILLFNWTITTP